MSRHKWKPAARLLWTLLITIPFLTGCWDRLEVEQRAAVLGLAIDSIEAGFEDKSGHNQSEMSGSKDASGENQSKMSGSDDVTASEEASFPNETPLHLTAQIAVPGRIPLGPGEGGGGGGTSPQQAVWILTADGKTLNDALARLQQQVADKIFLGHLRVITVSEEFARKQGLESITDTLRRNPEIRRTAWITISKGHANEVMKTAPPLERVPTLYLMSTMDHAQTMGKLPNDFLGVFESRAVMKGRQATLPYIEVVQTDNIHVAGLALFKGYKMIDTTKKPFDIATYMELNGVSAGGYTMLVPLPEQSGTVMVQAYRRKRKITVDIRNGLPHFNITIHIDGNIIGKEGGDFSVDEPMLIRAVELEMDKRLKENMGKFIAQTKQDDADVVGFGEYVRARKPSYWDQTIRTREKWDEIYPKASTDIKVMVKIHRVGMKGT